MTAVFRHDEWNRLLAVFPADQKIVKLHYSVVGREEDGMLNCVSAGREVLMHLVMLSPSLPLPVEQIPSDTFIIDSGERRAEDSINRL